VNDVRKGALMLTKTPGELLASAWKRIPPVMKVTFFAAFASGLLVHMFMFTNTLVNYDVIYYLISKMEGEIAGRWFAFFPDLISGTFNLPWMNGLLATLYLSLSACLVVSVLKIKDYLSSALIAALMVVTPSAAAIFCFIHSADVTFFGLLLACLAVYAAQKWKFGAIPAVVLVVLSLGIYQTWLGMCAGLMILVLIVDVLQNFDSVKKTILRGLKYFSVLVVGLGIYYLITKLLAPPQGLMSYMGLDQMGHIPLADIPFLVFRAYVKLAKYFLVNSRGFHYPFMGVFFALAGIAGCYLLVRWCRRHTMKLGQLATLALLLVLFPLGCNIIYVATPGIVHDLMVYPTILVPILLLMLISMHISQSKADETDQEAASVPPPIKQKLAPIMEVVSLWLVVGVTLLTVFNYGIVANKAYTKLTIAYEQAYAQSVGLTTRVQGVEGYKQTTPVVLVGRYNVGNSDHRPTIPEMDDFKLTGASSGDNLLFHYSYDIYLTRYLGFPNPMTYLYDGVLEDPVIAAELKQLPRYPDDGSIVVIDEVIYVHLSYPQ